MDETTLKGILDKTHLPVAYHHWNTPPALPYIVYLFIDSDNFGADNKVYKKANNYNIELYSEIKDTASELLIENALDAADIFYDKTETWIESENLFQVTYEI